VYDFISIINGLLRSSDAVLVGPIHFFYLV